MEVSENQHPEIQRDDFEISKNEIIISLNLSEMKSSGLIQLSIPFSHDYHDFRSMALLRSEEGKVLGLKMSNGRTRNVWFEKVI